MAGRPPGKSGGGSLTQIVSDSLKKSFDLDSFKQSKFLNKNVKFKQQRWIQLSKAFQEAVSLPGIAMGHINLLRGHSDTGKTTAMLECAVECQKMGILPIFIVTEMKWNWEHAIKMGFQLEEIPDPETGEVIDYKGFFIYIDRGSLNSIEDVASFIVDILAEQSKGKLPYDLCFLWDSIGSIPCNMSIEQGKNNPMWNAGAISTQFGNFINQRFPLSRKENSTFTNTLVCVNKVGVRPPENVMSQPKMTNKGGDTMFFDSSLVFTFGNVTNSGTSKIKATKNGRDFEFAKRTKIACDKNHINGIQSKGTIIMTVHGFIADDDAAVKEYKKEHANEWVEVLGSIDNLTITEDNSEFEENIKDIPKLIEDEQEVQ
jgi:hypothetical protein